MRTFKINNKEYKAKELTYGDIRDNEMNEHIINGGDLGDISEAFVESLSESRFFQAMVANATKETETQKATSAKKA